MTQIPTPPPPTTDPLDAGERELARLLADLPTAGPSPELDARVLAAARSAVQTSPRRRPIVWWRSIGMGAAASALLGIGLLLRMQGPGGLASTPSPATESAPAAQILPSPPVANAQSAPPPPPPPMAESTPPPKEMPPPARATEQAARAEAEGARPAAFPEQARAERQADKALSSQAARESSPVLAPEPVLPPPAPPPPPVVQAAPAPMAPSVDVTGSRIRREPTAPAAAKAAPAMNGGAQDAGTATVGALAAPSSRPGTSSRRSNTMDAPAALSVDEDARLPPAQWLQHIRQRLQAGDADGARASLQRFHARYPDAAIPDDLQPLLPSP